MNVDRDGPPDTGYLSSQDLQDQSVLLGDCFHGKSERPICQPSSIDTTGVLFKIDKLGY